MAVSSIACDPPPGRGTAVGINAMGWTQSCPRVRKRTRALPTTLHPATAVASRSTSGRPAPLGVLSLLVSVRVSAFGMSDGYQRLLDRCVEVSGADDRVVALFAVGSVGRGTADASSDLDLVIALVDQAAVEDVCAGWETLIEEITPTVYRRLLGTQIVTVVTPSWERLDITFMPAAATGFSRRDRRRCCSITGRHSHPCLQLRLSRRLRISWCGQRTSFGVSG
jgi:predicted nucleotidyltransferase